MNHTALDRINAILHQMYTIHGTAWALRFPKRYRLIANAEAIAMRTNP